MAELKVFTVISEINSLMDTSRKVPLSNLIMVDRTRMDQLLDRLAESLDPDLEKAEKLLVKRVDTKPQSGTGSAEKRRANAAGVYACPQPDRIEGKRILLVDDIVTTGATLCECAKMLHTAGAAEICGVAVASRN